MQSSYITSAAKAEQLPDLGGWPEVAFIGRSNCGKSSLLNALLGRVKLARESKTPGRTQMVNFFKVEKGDQMMYMADLPGYGFSATGREVRAHWQSLLEAYTRRPSVKEFLFLIDVRRVADMDDEDLDLLHYVGRIGPVTVVLTKVDKATQAELALARNKIGAILKEAGVKQARVAPVSATKGKGIEALREAVLGYLSDVVS